jgi:hypothetical protein
VSKRKSPCFQGLSSSDTSCHENLMVEPRGVEPLTSCLPDMRSPVPKELINNELENIIDPPSPVASPRNTGEVPDHIKEIVALIDGLTEQERVLLLAALIRKA